MPNVKIHRNSFLVVDLHTGGLDGWYSRREDAEAVAAMFSKVWRHEVVVLAATGPAGPIGNAAWDRLHVVPESAR